MQESKIRQTAYKLWIKELVTGMYTVQDGWNPNYVLTHKNKQVSRVNIIATLISKYINEARTYSTLSIDDGSSTIDLRLFKGDITLADNLEVGDLILTIGRPRLGMNNQIFILPEVIKVLKNPSWLKLRKLELLKLSGKPEEIEDKTTTISRKEIEIEESFIEEEIVSTQNSRRRILDSIHKLDSEEGVDISEVISTSKLPEEEAEFIVQELLKEGEIYEYKRGKLKIIE